MARHSFSAHFFRLFTLALILGVQAFPLEARALWDHSIPKFERDLENLLEKYESFENFEGDSPLLNPEMYAYGRCWLLDRLIQKRMNVHIQNAEGETPLVIALREGRQLCSAELLLQAGANPYVTDRMGTPILMILLSHTFLSESEVIKLIQNGVDPIQKDQYGQTALKFAKLHYYSSDLMRSNFVEERVNYRKVGRLLRRYEQSHRSLLRMGLPYEVAREILRKSF